MRRKKKKKKKEKDVIPPKTHLVEIKHNIQLTNVCKEFVQ
jgi:hypothetical protein